jgi:hypothetical protein
MRLKIKKSLRNALFSDNQIIRDSINSNTIDLSFDNNFLLSECLDYFELFNFNESSKEKIMDSTKLLLNDTNVLDNLQHYLEDSKEEVREYFIDYLKSINKINYLNINTFGKYDISISNKFITYCKNGNYKKVMDLIDNPSVKINFKSNEALFEAANNGNVKIFKELIQRKEINPSDNGQKVLYAAISANSHQILSILLKDKRIDPTSHDNYPYYYSIYVFLNSFRYKIHCFNLLKKDTRIDLSAFDNSILYNIIMDISKHLNNPNNNKYYNIIDALLENKNVYKKVNSSFIKKIKDNTYRFENENPYIFNKLKNIAKINKLSLF